MPESRHPVLKRGFIGAVVVAAAILFVAASIAPARAQPYPAKPIRFLVGMTPGGTQDTLGRIIVQKLAERLGQPVVVDNRGGSAGNVALEVAAGARADGYTLVLASTSIAISPSLYRKLNYELRDFAPISLVAQSHYLLVVRSSLQVNSVKDFVEYARANPGKLNYGSSGLGTAPQLASELLKGIARVDITHVPYKGASQMLGALVAGEVDMLMVSPGVTIPFMQSGRVKALMVLSKERLPSLPDVPVAKEAGIDNMVVTGWQGLLAPTGTAPDVISRLSAEWGRIAATAAARELIQKAGFDPLSSTPEEFAQHLRAEVARWSKVVKQANIKVE